MKGIEIQAGGGPADWWRARGRCSGVRARCHGDHVNKPASQDPRPSKIQTKPLVVLCLFLGSKIAPKSRYFHSSTRIVC